MRKVSIEHIMLDFEQQSALEDADTDEAFMLLDGYVQSLGYPLDAYQGLINYSNFSLMGVVRHE